MGIIRGSKGSIFYDGEKIYRQGIKKVEAVDTMGTGDSFIAGFLTSYGDGKSMEKALTCLVRGGFGHPHKA